MSWSADQVNVDTEYSKLIQDSATDTTEDRHYGERTPSGDDGQAQQQQQPNPPFLWRTILIIACFEILNNAAIWGLSSPQMPFVRKDYWGDHLAGQLASYVHGGCCILGVPLGLLLGRLSDATGRRPIMILVSTFGLWCPLSLYLWYPNPWPSLVSNSIAQIVANVGWGVESAMIADAYPECHRVFAFSVFVASRMVGTFASFAADIPGATNTIMQLTAIATGGVGLVYTCLMMPETLKPNRRFDSSRRLLQHADASADLDAESGNLSTHVNETHEEVHPQMSSACCGPQSRFACFSAFTAPLKNRVVLMAILASGLSDGAWFGIGDISGYYMIDRVHFTKQDGGITGPEGSLLKLPYLLCLIPLASRWLSSLGIAQMGNTGMLLHVLSYLVLFKKWQVFVMIIPLQSSAVMSGPGFRNLIALNSDPTEQALMQAAFAVYVDLISGILQFVMGTAYKALPSWMVFLLAGVLAAAAIAVTAAMVLVKGCKLNPPLSHSKRKM